MKLIRYEHPSLPSFNDVDRFFDLALRDFGRFGSGDLFGRSRSAYTPADLYEDEDNFYVRFELPGVNKQEIAVELENAVLTVSVNRKDESDEQGAATYEATRSVSVPDGVDADKVKAAYEDGILTVTLPKSEARKPRLIDVG